MADATVGNMSQSNKSQTGAEELTEDQLQSVVGGAGYDPISKKQIIGHKDLDADKLVGVTKFVPSITAPTNVK